MPDAIFVVLLSFSIPFLFLCCCFLYFFFVGPVALPCVCDRGKERNKSFFLLYDDVVFVDADRLWAAERWNRFIEADPQTTPSSSFSFCLEAQPAALLVCRKNKKETLRSRSVVIQPTPDCVPVTSNQTETAPLSTPTEFLSVPRRAATNSQHGSHDLIPQICVVDFFILLLQREEVGLEVPDRNTNKKITTTPLQYVQAHALPIFGRRGAHDWGKEARCHDRW